MVAVKVKLFPLLKVADFLFSLIDFAAIGDLTVTFAFTDFAPLTVAVIVVEPFDFAVTFPLLVTVAIFGLDDFHVTDLSVLSDGETVAFSVAVLPAVKDKLDLFNFTVLGETFTVTFFEILGLSLAVAVIVAVPLAIPLIFPFESTVATFVFELFQWTVLFVASDGVTVAFTLYVCFVAIFRFVLLNFIPEGMTFVTVTGMFVLTESAPFAVTVIVAFPAFSALTLPF